MLSIASMAKSNAFVIVSATVLMLFCGSSPLLAQGTAPPLELLVLGSGGPGAAGRAAASYLVFVDGVARILVDAGPGSFARLGESHASLSNVDLVLITHLHIDHVGELPGLFKARAVSGSGPVVFNVWGPAGSPGHGQDAYFPSTREFMQLLFGPKGAFAYLSDFASPVSIRVHDIAAPAANAAAEQIFMEGGLSIRAVPGHHADAPAVIYRIDHGGKERDLFRRHRRRGSAGPARHCKGYGSLGVQQRGARSARLPRRSLHAAYAAARHRSARQGSGCARAIVEPSLARG